MTTELKKRLLEQEGKSAEAFAPADSSSENTVQRQPSSTALLAFEENSGSGNAGQTRIAALEAALKEFADPRNWVINGRFDPHSGNFDATTFARAALASGGGQATGGGDHD